VYIWNEIWIILWMYSPFETSIVGINIEVFMAHLYNATCYGGPLCWKSKKTECGEESVFRGLSAKRPLMRLWRRMTSRIGSFALFFIVYTTVVFHFHFCARFDKEFEQSNAETMTRRNRGPPPIFYPRVVFLHHSLLAAPP